MKKILINGRFLNQNITGVQRVAFEVVIQIDNRTRGGVLDNEDIQIEIAVPPEMTNEIPFKNIPVIRSKNKFFEGHLWEQIVLPQIADGALLVNFCNTGPLFFKNQTVTIHDGSVFAHSKSFSLVFRLWYAVLWRTLSRNARMIFTDSIFSKLELCKYLKTPPEKIEVVYLGKEHISSIEADISILERCNLNGKRFLLVVGSLDPRKNLQGIMNAIAHLQEKKEYLLEVVVVGGTYSHIFKKIALQNLKNVSYVGRISDAELKALYLNAICLVYPSFYEGFGLPPIEAMSCGCPVILSRLSSLPEIGGDAVQYCNAYDIEDICNKIEGFLTNENVRTSFRQKGLLQANKFSWENCANNYIDQLKKILN